MTQSEEAGEPELLTLRQLAKELGITPENIRALEKRGRLPRGCEPTIDPVSSTRYWTPDQVKKLKEWNAERTRATAGE